MRADHVYKLRRGKAPCQEVFFPDSLQKASPQVDKAWMEDLLFRVYRKSTAKKSTATLLCSVYGFVFNLNALEYFQAHNEVVRCDLVDWLFSVLVIVF